MYMQRISKLEEDFIELHKLATFADVLRTANPGQRIFKALFNINRVYVDGMLFTTGYTGKGTNTIVFDVGRNDGSEIYLTT